MLWHPISNAVLLLLLSCALIESFLIRFRRHVITPVWHPPTLPSTILLHASGGRGRGRDNGRRGRSGRRRGGQNPQLRGGGRRPVSPDDFLVATKWGRIQRPDLFELFDPSKPDGDESTIERRSLALREVNNERILTSILNSWARAYRAPDAGDRCHGVLQHLREHKSRLRIQVIIYNVVLNAYARRKEALKADFLLREMLNTQGVKPDVQTYNCVMNAWSKSDEDDAPERCKELLSQMSNIPSSSDNLYVTPNTVTYNTVIDAYAARGRAMEAEEVLRAMLSAPGVEPDVRTFSCVINAWSKSDEDDAPQRCEALLSQMNRISSSRDDMDVAPNTVTYNTVIDAYAARGRPMEAEEVLRAMLSAPAVKPDVRTFNSVMNAWSKSDENGAPEHCKDLLSQMNSISSSSDNKDVAPNTVTYNTIIDAYAVRGRAMEAEEVLRAMLSAQGVEPDVRTFNSVINAWSKSDDDGAPEHCMEFLNQMISMSSLSESKDVAPNTITYNTVIAAYAARGRAMDAEEVFREMLKTPGVEPNVQTFSCVINAWSKSDEDDAPERCEALLSQMNSISSSRDDMDVAPNTVTYNSVIDAYAARGRAMEAEEVLQTMLSAPSVEPDVRTFNCVINAWSKSDEYDAPERCKEFLSQMNSISSSRDDMDVAPDTVTYNTVLDAYAVRGRAVEAEEVLQDMISAPDVEPNVLTFSIVMNAWSQSNKDDAPERCKRLQKHMTSLASKGQAEIVPNNVAVATLF